MIYEPVKELTIDNKRYNIVNILGSLLILENNGFYKIYGRNSKEYKYEYQKRFHTPYSELDEEQKEYIREYGRKQYIKHREKILIYAKQFYEDNKDKIREYKKQWYLKNKKRIEKKQNTEEYKARHRELARNRRARRTEEEKKKMRDYQRIYQKQYKLKKKMELSN